MHSRRISRALPAVGLLIAVLAFPSQGALAAPAPAPTAAAHGALVYVHYDGDYDLWTVGTNGGRPVELAEAPAATYLNTTDLEHMPVYSPDGRYLAFEGRRSIDGAQSGVYVFDTATGKTSRVATPAQLYVGPTGWFVDSAGPHVVFVQDKAPGAMALEAWEAVVTAGAPAPPRQLTNLTGSVMDVEVTGSSLVFQYGAAHGSGPHGICTAPLGTGQVVDADLACISDPATSNDVHPGVSPSGDIAFIRNGTVPQLVVHTSNSERVVPVPSTLKVLSDPAYSPDGKTIAFAGGTTTSLTSADIWTVPAAGGTAQNLTKANGTDYVPAWRP